jgi:WD40 repeat protein
MNPKQLKQAKQWKWDDILFCIATNAPSERIFVGSSDFSVSEFDPWAESAERVRFEDHGHQSYVTGLTMADGLLVSASYDRHLIWWDPTERRPIRSVTAHDRWIRRLITLPGEKHVVSIGDDMLCKVWDVETGQLLAAFTDHRPMTPHHYPSMLYAVTASADGKLLATGDKVGHVAIWRTDTFEKVGQLEAPVMYTWDPKQRRHSIGGIRSLAFSPDARHLAVGGIGTIGNIDHLGGPARMEVFEWQSGKRSLETEDEKYKGLIQQIVWSQDGQWILTAGGDNKGFVTFYDANSGDIVHQAAADHHIHAFQFDEQNRSLITAGHTQLIKWAFDEPAVAG